MRCRGGAYKITVSAMSDGAPIADGLVRCRGGGYRIPVSVGSGGASIADSRV